MFEFWSTDELIGAIIWNYYRRNCASSHSKEQMRVIIRNQVIEARARGVKRLLTMRQIFDMPLE